MIIVIDNEDKVRLFGNLKLCCEMMKWSYAYFNRHVKLNDEPKHYKGYKVYKAYH